ncbi:hypothetical protein Dimus_026375 [Dionaea muscipula]
MCKSLWGRYITLSEAHNHQVAEKKIAELEAARDLSRLWLHVDMDAFYAAVEMLSSPSLKGKPVAVGSLSMISTANYEARRYGVRAAMPGFIARKLCPELTFVPTDFQKYIHYSNVTRKVFQSYDPNFLAASLDEAYLDITEVCKTRGATSAEIAEELRRNVFLETGLTCSAGVAPNRLLAKVCSDINKPNGQFVLPNDRVAVMTFISSLPIRKIGGIGKVTERILREVFGINTCEEMLKKCGLLCGLFSLSSADFFLCVGLGLGKTNAPEVKMRKSMSNERTFSPTGDEGLLHKKLAELAELLAADLQKEGLHGKTLTLKLKTASFEVRTRAVTLQKDICSSEDILRQASKLLKAEFPISLRLIGLRVSHFREDAFDPAQKSIMNFVIPGDASGNNEIDHNCLESDVIGGDYLMVDPAGDLTSTGGAADCSHNHQPLLDSGGESCTLNNCALDREKNDSIRDDPFAQMNYPGSTSCASEPWDSEAEQLSNTNLTSSSHDSRIADEGTNTSDVQGADAVASSSERDRLLWVDGYKCSICGIELPPFFVEERQEHSDFHLAEKLQEDESGIGSNSKSNRMKQRLAQKDKVRSLTGRRKKHKASTCRERTIVEVEDLRAVSCGERFLADGLPYDYSATIECLENPRKPQYGGGIIVNPEFNHGLEGWSSFGGAKLEQRALGREGNNFIVAYAREKPYASLSQKVHLDKDMLYTFSAWIQVSKGNAQVTALFKTADGFKIAGAVVAESGCWSMLKGGLTVDSSGSAEFYFQTNNTSIDVWVDSISLQPFTHEEWSSHQQQSIEQVRKSKVRLQVVNSHGDPVSGAKLRLTQIRSGFPLGACINKNILKNVGYQNWFTSKPFTVTVFENEMKWYSTEYIRGKEDYSDADALLQFAKQHRLAVRGHNIFWDDPTYQLGWVKSLSGSDLWAAVNQRVKSVVSRYQGQVMAWDVVNENLHFNFFEGKLGGDASSILFQKACQFDGQAVMFMNEYNTIEDSRDQYVTPLKYLQKLREIQRYPGNSGPTAIGLEGHFSNVNIPYMRSVLDTLKTAGVPIWITELDVAPGPNQASYLEQVMREAYSHPAIAGLVLWVAWSPNGCYKMCLTDNNFRNLPTGDVVDKLIGEWRLRSHNQGVVVVGSTDVHGFLDATLSHGEYEVEITAHHDTGMNSSFTQRLTVAAAVGDHKMENVIKLST